MSDTSTNEPTQTAGEAGSSTNVSSTGQPPAAANAGERTFTQAELDMHIKNRLAEQKRKLEDDAKAEKAKAQGEYQTLAQTYEARVRELEPQIEQLTAATAERDALIDQLIRDRVKALPDELRDLLPKDGPIAAKVSALIGFEKAAAKLAGQRSAGTPAGPTSAAPGAMPLVSGPPRRIGDGF